jgi:hypothetical protein
MIIGQKIMSLLEGPTKQPSRIQYASDEVAALSFAMTYLRFSRLSFRRGTMRNLLPSA